MNTGKAEHRAVGRAFLWTMVLVFLVLFSPRGSGAGAGSSAVLKKDVAVAGVTPSPSIKVLAKTATTNAGMIAPGDFSVTMDFTIESNASKVSLYLEASDLYWGGDATDPRKIGPIGLNTGRAVEIIVPSGRRIAGPPNVVSWLGTGNPIANFPGKKTETVTYEFPSTGNAVQNVSCKFWYAHSNALRRAGQYGGQVRLNAFLSP